MRLYGENIRLETLNETPLDLRKVTDIIECEAIWREYNDVIEHVKRGEDVPGAKSIRYDDNSDDLQIALMFKSEAEAKAFHTFLNLWYMDNPLVVQCGVTLAAFTRSNFCKPV